MIARAKYNTKRNKAKASLTDANFLISHREKFYLGSQTFISAIVIANYIQKLYVSPLNIRENTNVNAPTVVLPAGPGH